MLTHTLLLHITTASLPAIHGVSSEFLLEEDKRLKKKDERKRQAENDGGATTISRSKKRSHFQSTNNEDELKRFSEITKVGSKDSTHSIRRQHTKVAIRSLDKKELYQVTTGIKPVATILYAAFETVKKTAYENGTVLYHGVGMFKKPLCCLVPAKESEEVGPPTAAGRKFFASTTFLYPVS